MTALPDIDPLAKKLAPLMREMMLEEVRRLAAVQPKPAPREKADDEIMDACRAVAAATDRLELARYSRQEIFARKTLERAAAALGVLLRKHGRMGGQG